MGLFSNPARSFFSKEEGALIVQAIKEAELNTSGEIRVHIENKVKGGDVMKRAMKVFGKLNMHKTESHNGVIVYFAVSDHQFSIFADEGINKVVPDGFWDEVVGEMAENFKQQQFVAGLTGGIKKIGLQLKEFFPWQSDDVNELPDEISFG